MIQPLIKFIQGLLIAQMVEDYTDVMAVYLCNQFQNLRYHFS